MKIAFLFCWLMVGCWQIGMGQDFSYRLMDKSKGLPSNTVYDILQDSKGFIWIGSDKGLFRFDGSNYLGFEHLKQNDKAASNLMLDAQGRVWFQNFTGQFFYVENNVLQYAKMLVPTGSFHPAAVVGGKFLMSVNNAGIRILDTQKETLKEIKVNTFGFSAYSFADKQNYYLMNPLHNTVLETDVSGRQFVAESKLKPNFFYYAKTPSKQLFLGKTDVSEITILEKNGQINKIQLGRKNLVQNIKLIDDNTLAVFTPSGMYYIDLQQYKAVWNPIFIDKNTTSLLKDREGNYWVTTINSGILFVPSLGMNTIMPQRAFTRLQALQSNNTLVCGTTSNEVLMFDLAKKNSQKVLHKGNTNAEVSAIYYDNKTQALAVNSDKFLYSIKGKAKGGDVLAVKDIEKFDKNHLAIAATGFMGLFNTSTFAKSEAFNTELFRCRAIAVDTAQKVVYGASSRGLIKTKITGQSTTSSYINVSLSLTDLASQIVTKNTDSQVFRLYASSINDGIFGIENDKVFLHLSTTNGLENNSVYRIKVYKNKLWWLTEKAVQSYDFDKKTIKTYSNTDGLPDADLKDLAFLNDTVYVATLAGIVSFPIDFQDKNQYVPKIIINQVFSNKQKVGLGQDLVFEYQQNNIDVDFSVIAYKGHDSHLVQYRINDQPWQMLPSLVRTLSLPSLASGNYTIQFKATNEDKLDSPTESLKFKIAKPFWLSFWFMGLAVAMVGALIGVLYRNRVSRLNRESKLYAEKLTLEQDLQKSLLTTIKSQMNPHFIFNALNTIQSYIYLNDKQNASNYLGKFSELTRMILDMSNDETVSLKNELKAIELYLSLEQMRFEDTLTYSITIAPTLETEGIRLPSMLIQPYVENAIKHGLLHKKNNRILEVEFLLEGSVLMVIIEDNGVGRKKSNEINQTRARRYESFATKANQKRLELLNFGQPKSIGIEIIDKYNNENTPTGTKVILQVPILSKNH